MGKSKKLDPEPDSEKIIRKLGENLTIEVSEAEKRYRNKNGPDDLSQVNKEKLKCTVCARSLADLLKMGNEPYVHMLLNVLMCRDCSTFYGDGYFSVDEDGDDKYCRWCGQGGTLYLCSSCTCAFCKKCIKQNLNRQDVKDMESDDWKCLICRPNPLFECRTLCWYLQENYKTKEKEDDEESGKGKRNHSNKNEERRGSKRKANDDPIEVRSKRQKSTDSAKDNSDVQKKSNDISVSDRKRRSQSLKEVEKPDEKKIKSSRTEKSSKRKSKLENESTSVSNNLAKKSSKIEEILISDEDEEDLSESSPKKTKNQNSKRDSLKKATPPMEKIDKRPKRSLPKIELKSPETKKVPSKSADKKSRSSSEKNKKSKSSNKVETPAVKRSQRSCKNNTSYQEESDVESKKSDSGSQLISLDDDNSSSESENKKRTSRGKSKAKLKTVLNKLSLSTSKDATEPVIEGSGFINSAVNDVLELTVLIANRCEKLCSRSVQSVDDLTIVFNKMKQLMGGVHTNLELIEKGLDTKINVWKGVNASDIKIPEENLEIETKLSLQNSSSPNKVKEEEEIKIIPTDSLSKEHGEGFERTSSDSLKEKKKGEIKTSLSISPNKKKEEETETSSSNEKEVINTTSSFDKENLKNDEKIDEDLKNDKEIDKDLKNDTEMYEDLKNDEKIEEDFNNIEKMEVEDSQVETRDEEVKNIDNVKLIENQEDSMNKEDNEIKKDSLKTDAKETVTVDPDDIDSDSEIDKRKQLSQEEKEFEEPLENKDSVDEIKSDAVDENIDLSHSIGNDESVDKLVSNNDSSISECNTNNENVKSGEKKSEMNNFESEKTENGKIESSESEKNEDEEDEIYKNSTLDCKEEKCHSIGKDDNYVKEDVNNCILKGDVNSVVSDDTDVIQSNTDKLNGLTSTNSENLADGSISQVENILGDKEEVCDQKEAEEEIHSKLHLNEGSPEVKESAEEKTPAKQIEDADEPKRDTAEKVDVKHDDKEKKKEHSSSESRQMGKREDSNSSRTEDRSSSGFHHQSERDSSRSSGDRDRHRWSGGWENRERGHNWNRDQYSQERGWSGGRGSSWNRYDDRRTNRGGWGWKR